MYTIFVDIMGFIPEIVLGGSILSLLAFAVFLKEDLQEHIFFARLMFGIFGSLGAVILVQNLHPLFLFNSLFITDAYTLFIKFFILSVTFLIYSFSFAAFKVEKIATIELSVFILMILLGMFVMISSNDFMSLYLGMELQNIALYVLIAFKKESLKNNEAAVKYFILGALSSGILLFGLSLIYGAVGSLNFQDIYHIIKIICTSSSDAFNSYLVWGGVLGFLFVFSAFLFKLSIVPFHMWAPDVYEGVPLPMAAFLALVPKIVILSVIMRAWAIGFSESIIYIEASIFKIFPVLIMGAALLSIAGGTFGALAQSNLKRLLAYSGISHMGFILLALSLGSYEGLRAALIYLFSYVIMGIGLFSCLCALRYAPGQSRIGIIKDISDLKGLSKTHPKMALCLTLLIFSFTGVPPLIGFFAKLYLILSLLEKEFIGISIYVGLASVVAAVYYLRMVKYIYFEDSETSFEVAYPFSFTAPLFLSMGNVLFFFLHSKPLLWCVSFVTQSLLRR